MNIKTKRLICGGVFLLSLGSFIWFALLLSQTRAEYKQSEQDLERIWELRGEENLVPEEVKSEMDEASLRSVLAEEQKAREERFKRLREENSDMVGWIRIEDTPVDYPVMQTKEEPDFYLHRGFNKKYSAYGMIYMDASCLMDESSNYILYGHHMKNGTMFASLEKYKSKKYFEEHPIIYFDTESESEIYDVLAAFRLPASQMNTEFAYKLAAGTKEDYEGLIDYISANRLYGTGVTAEWPAPLLTLTTCEYSQRDGRFFVIAKKREK